MRVELYFIVPKDIRDKHRGMGPHPRWRWRSGRGEGNENRWMVVAFTADAPLGQ